MEGIECLGLSIDKMEKEKGKAATLFREDPDSGAASNLKLGSMTRVHRPPDPSLIPDLKRAEFSDPLRLAQDPSQHVPQGSPRAQTLGPMRQVQDSSRVVPQVGPFQQQAQFCRILYRMGWGILASVLYVRDGGEF